MRGSRSASIIPSCLVARVTLSNTDNQFSCTVATNRVRRGPQLARLDERLLFKFRKHPEVPGQTMFQA